MAIIATHAQIIANVIMPCVDEFQRYWHNCHNGLLDQVGQAYVLAWALNARAIFQKSICIFAYKVLKLLVFSNVDLLATNFNAWWIFHLAHDMLEGKMLMQYVVLLNQSQRLPWCMKICISCKLSLQLKPLQQWWRYV